MADRALKAHAITPMSLEGGPAPCGITPQLVSDVPENVDCTLCVKWLKEMGKL